MRGSFSRSLDRAAQLITVEAKGFWTLEQVQEHFSELATMVADLRAYAGGVRVLVDLREACPQSQDVAEAVRVQTGRVYSTIDRIAIVVSSELQKMQMARLTQALNARIFADPVAALRWLDGPSTPDSSRDDGPVAR